MDDTPHHKKKKVPIIFIEGDGLMLKGGKSVRPELHRVQIHEGVITDTKRPCLINSLLFESTESSQKAYDGAGNWIDMTYNLKTQLSLLIVMGEVATKKISLNILLDNVNDMNILEIVIMLIVKLRNDSDLTN